MNNRPQFLICEVRDLQHKNLLQYEIINAVKDLKHTTLADMDDLDNFEKRLHSLCKELNEKHPKCKKIIIERMFDGYDGFIITLRADGLLKKQGFVFRETPFVTFNICKILGDWKGGLK